MEKFQIGDQVRWVSQSGGNTKEKKGVIHHIVPPYVSTHSKHYKEIYNPGNKYKMMWDGMGFVREFTSYIVLVESKSGRGKKKLYWPIVSKLHKLLQGEDPMGPNKPKYNLKKS